ncbi:MAG: cytochrome c3 family protein [Desulfuromonadales bacterium]|nr:cytochrome c3 family protein [Desulfuromonadales bacterium]
MKKVLLVVALLTQNAFAADVIEFKHNVEFDHQSHKMDKVGKCVVCHEQKPGKIAGFGKTWAHKNCIDCHDLYQEGPRRCGGCHRHTSNA